MIVFVDVDSGHAYEFKDGELVCFPLLAGNAENVQPDDVIAFGLDSEYSVDFDRAFSESEADQALKAKLHQIQEVLAVAEALLNAKKEGGRL